MVSPLGLSVATTWPRLLEGKSGIGVISRFDVSDLLKPSLPGWYGTGVSEPAGHDGYFVFGTTDQYVKFLVLATIDLHVDWP